MTVHVCRDLLYRMYVCTQLAHALFSVVPTDIRNLVITDDATNLVISWNEPAELNGNISYITTIVCEDLFDNSIFLNETEVVLLADPIAIARRPYILCSVTVTPQTGAGAGNSSTESFQTPEAGNHRSLCII